MLKKFNKIFETTALIRNCTATALKITLKKASSIYDSTYA
jgi:hypothetical protein